MDLRDLKDAIEQLVTILNSLNANGQNPAKTGEATDQIVQLEETLKSFLGL